MTERFRNGLIPIIGSYTNSHIAMNLSSGILIDNLAVSITRIRKFRISHSGEDYPKRPSSVSGSELAGELMKRTSEWFTEKKCRVKAYYRSDGTFVRGHYKVKRKSEKHW